MSIIKAPWSDEQVTSLNAYQNCNEWHPFTGTRKPNGDETPLIATPSGWVEEENGPIIQDWAHSWMTNWEWRTMAKPIEKSPNAQAIRNGKLFDKFTTDKMFIACNDQNQMIPFRIKSTPYYYAPLFSTKEKLEKTLTEAKVEWHSTRQVIDNDGSFINNLPRFFHSLEVKIIIDPEQISENSTRYTEIKRPPIISNVKKLN